MQPNFDHDYEDNTCVPLRYQCCIILVNESVPRRTSRAYIFSLTLPYISYMTHPYRSMLYNIDILMAHKCYPIMRHLWPTRYTNSKNLSSNQNQNQFLDS